MVIEYWFNQYDCKLLMKEFIYQFNYLCTNYWQSVKICGVDSLLNDHLYTDW